MRVRRITLSEQLLLSFQAHFLAMAHNETRSQLNFFLFLDFEIWSLWSLDLSLILFLRLWFQGSTGSEFIPLILISFELVDGGDLGIDFAIFRGRENLFVRSSHLGSLDWRRILRLICASEKWLQSWWHRGFPMVIVEVVGSNRDRTLPSPDCFKEVGILNRCCRLQWVYFDLNTSIWASLYWSPRRVGNLLQRQLLLGGWFLKHCWYL